MDIRDVRHPYKKQRVLKTGGSEKSSIYLARSQFGSYVFGDQLDDKLIHKRCSLFVITLTK